MGKDKQKIAPRNYQIFTNILLTATVSFALAWILENQIFPKLLPWQNFFESSPVTIALIFCVTLSVVTLGAKALLKELSKANYAGKSSSYLNILICISSWFVLIFAKDFSLFAAASFLFAIIGIGSRRFLRPTLDLSTLTRRFAPNSLGIKSADNLKFHDSAKNAADGLSKRKNYVSVITLKGGYGEGKSSYARMIVENISPKKSLYSYISLTETNETKDFSKLFAERWFEALEERYPTLNITPRVTALKAILRESFDGGKFFSIIFDLLALLDFGLRKTAWKCHDKNVTPPTPYVKKSTAKMFNYIPEIKEKIWIIVIDEIERAQFDEIYRVIEIIERFRCEGRFGLPVRIVFLLCMSGEDLKARIEESRNNNEKAKLICDFFFNDPKTCDGNLFLPPIPRRIKEKFVLKKLSAVLSKFDLGDADKEFKEMGDSRTIADPRNSYLSKKDASRWIFQELCKISPRIIDKICQELEFFYHCFRDITGIPAPHFVTVCDVIAISYVKVKYPFLIEFFKSEKSKPTLSDVAAFRELIKSDGNNSQKNYLQKKFDEIFDGRKHEATNQITDLVGLVAHECCNPVKEISNNIEMRHRRTSDDYVMTDVLRLIATNSNANHHTSYTTYGSPNHKESVSKLSTKDLLQYAYDLDVVSNAAWEKYLEVADELILRLENESAIKQDGSLPKDTVHNTASYRFLFAISYAIEKEADRRGEQKLLVWKCVKKFLTSDKISIEAKYIFLNGFVNNSRADSSTGFRLVNLFTSLTEDKVSEKNELIQSVFEDANKRYFSGDKSIYENEENFAYVLFQSWCGKNYPENVDPIRKAALRNLEFYPKAIDYYWSQYENFEKIGQSKFTTISLEDLLATTEQAIELADDENLKNNLISRKNSFSILKQKITESTAAKIMQANSSAVIFGEFGANESFKPLMAAMIDQDIYR